MTKEELQYTLAVETYLLKKGVRPSALIYNMTDSNLKHLERFCEEDEEINFCFDPEDDKAVWLFKNDSVRVLVENIYRMNWDAIEMAMGFLLGYSFRECDEWLKKIRDNKNKCRY